jgi:hypothetical protein
MSTKFKFIALFLGGMFLTMGLTACSHKSDTVSQNISNDADQYKVFRQIVVHDDFTNTYTLEVDGYCALGNDDTGNMTTYTCKTPNGYIKDIIYSGNNTTVFAHQIGGVKVSDTYFKKVLRPESILPDITFQ